MAAALVRISSMILVGTVVSSSLETSLFCGESGKRTSDVLTLG